MQPDKWSYLLTGLMHPLREHGSARPTTGSERPADIALHEIGISLKRVFLTEQARIHRSYEPYQAYGRFLFQIRDGARDDSLAQHVADAVSGALALIHDLAMEEHPTAIPVHAHVVRRDMLVRLKDIIGNERSATDLYSSLVRCVGLPSLDDVWHMVPALVACNSLMSAAHFYRDSISQMHLVDDDLLQITLGRGDIPASRAEATRVATAYQNVYKAIEAVIGEPPKDERKFRDKLVAAGVDPDELVCYAPCATEAKRETIVSKLRSMQRTIDKRAAHGKTASQQPIT